MSSSTEAHSVSLAGFKAAADSFQVNALQLAYRVYLGIKNTFILNSWSQNHSEIDPLVM